MSGICRVKIEKLSRVLTSKTLKKPTAVVCCSQTVWVTTSQHVCPSGSANLGEEGCALAVGQATGLGMHRGFQRWSRGHSQVWIWWHHQHKWDSVVVRSGMQLVSWPVTFVLWRDIGKIERFGGGSEHWPSSCVFKDDFVSIVASHETLPRVVSFFEVTSLPSSPPHTSGTWRALAGTSVCCIVESWGFSRVTFMIRGHSPSGTNHRWFIFLHNGMEDTWRFFGYVLMSTGKY